MCGMQNISTIPPDGNESRALSPAITIGPIGIAAGQGLHTNGDLAERFNTAPEVITRKTGIESRPIAGPDVRPKDLALQAVESLRAGAEFDPSALAMIIVSSSSISQVCPPVACEILAAISARGPVPSQIMAFDIMATCTGWLYGLTLACDYLDRPAMTGRTALIVTTEIFSQGIRADDFGAQVSFGDAATATLVWRESPAATGVVGQTGWMRMRRPLCFSAPDKAGALWGPPLNMDAKMKLNGSALREASLPALVEGLEAALADAGLVPADLSAILAHQSNHRVLADLAAAMGVPANLMATNLRNRGNTSSSALPLLIHDLRQHQPEMFASGANVGFTAFGGGFTYGGAIAKVL